MTQPQQPQAPTSPKCHKIYKQTYMPNHKNTFESAQFVHPLVVASYDTICAIDDEYKIPIIELAQEIGSQLKIVDVGCGTGLMAIPLAKEGHDVIGVEPAPAMLDVAKKKDSNVLWVEGLAKDLESYNADLVIMTGHIAQFHLSDQDWNDALIGIHRSLKKGAYLIFDSRNPNQLLNKEGSWQASEDDPNIIEDPKLKTIHTWTQSKWQAKDKTLHYTLYYNFVDQDNTLVTSEDVLKFRTEEQLRNSLEQQGFAIQDIYGWWDRSPVTDDCREFIVIAKKK